MNSKEVVRGFVTGSVKGGLTVDIGVIKAFLPGSLVDIRPVKDFDFLQGQEIEALVIKMDEVRNNIVISRKAVMQEVNSADREALIETLDTGKEVEGIVKNLADYGAFVDLGGVDGLLHITDISWQRVNHPSERLSIGDKIKVKILNYDKEKMRVSLGLKQLTPSPWDNIFERLPIGKKIVGVVSNLTDYGAFVRIEEGVEGLVHVSEMDWTNANARPSKFVKLGQEVDVVVLDVQESKHRISLSMKQAKENPWGAFESSHNRGDNINVIVKSITDFGLFVGLPGGIDGLIHLADISWVKQSADQIVSNYSKGQEIDVVILNIDAEKERISLGIKQLTSDNFTQYVSANTKGSIVKGSVTEVNAKGAVIELAEGITGYLKVSEISQDRIEDASTVLKQGIEVEVVITQIDRKARKVSLSIKAKESVEEKTEMENYKKQSPESNGSTLGDLLKEVKDK
jgi:small subunit ribosomal protein S1